MVEFFPGRQQLKGRHQGRMNVLIKYCDTTKPNDKWLSDITEFAIPAGKVYLSSIADCFDGMVVAWTAGTNPNAALVNASDSATEVAITGGSAGLNL